MGVFTLEGQLIFPLRIGQVVNGLRCFLRFNEVGVVDDHADAGRETRPVSIGVFECRRNAFRIGRFVRCKHSATFEHQSPHRFVRPEDICLRVVLFGEQFVGEPGALGLFGVVYRVDLCPGLLFISLQDRL